VRHSFLDLLSNDGLLKLPGCIGAKSMNDCDATETAKSFLPLHYQLDGCAKAVGFSDCSRLAVVATGDMGG
jgi:hypothetical protein